MSNQSSKEKLASIEVLRECSVRALAVGVKDHKITLQEVLDIGRAADELERRRAAETSDEPALKGTYACPVCERETPHTHADQLAPLTDAQCKDISNQARTCEGVDWWPSVYAVREIDRIIRHVRGAVKTNCNCSGPDAYQCSGRDLTKDDPCPCRCHP